MNQIGNGKFRTLVIVSFLVVIPLILITRPMYSISNKPSIHFFGFKATLNFLKRLKTFRRFARKIFRVSQYTVFRRHIFHRLGIVYRRELHQP